MRKCAKCGKVMMSDLRLKVNGGGFKFHHADFTFVAKFPNLEWILCRRGFGKYSHTADGMLGKVK